VAELEWGTAEAAQLEAIRGPLAEVSTATACQMLQQLGWRNTYMEGLLPLTEVGLGRRLVGRARTVRYLPRREAEVVPQDEEARAALRRRRRTSPEIVLIESLEPGDFFCADALGFRTAGIIGDILSTRIKARGALAAVIHGVVRDSPFVKTVGLPVYCAGAHPAAVGRELIAADCDVPIHLAGVHVIPGDVLLADDEGVVAMPLELATYVAQHGPEKERLELWIRERIERGGSVHDYYPPTPEALREYEEGR
jgi:5-oxopent-3-ene-1,2,5-tricarboxylate decarboxylase/2-hydroxyhepta-2,4-diene-1,7-dioate isomerase